MNKKQKQLKGRIEMAKKAAISTIPGDFKKNNKKYQEEKIALWYLVNHPGLPEGLK
jgi:transposase